MSFHRTTLLDAVAEGFVEKVNEVKTAKGRPTQTRDEFVASIRKGCLTVDAYNSQYLCIPNQANGEALIAAPDLSAALKPFEILRLELKGDGGTLDVIDPSCEPYTHAEYWKKRLDEKRRYALGWDIARTGDLGSIWANRDDGEKSYTLASLITLKTCKFESQRRIMEALLDGLPLAVGCGDKTGLGMSSCETLEQEYPGRFVGCNFSALKITLGTTMQSVFEQRRQSIPIDRPEIRLDLAGIKKTSTPGGRLTFTEAGNELLPDSHNDIAWSCALAHYAGETLDDFGPCFMAAARAPEPPPLLSAAAGDEWGGLGIRQNRRQGNW
ncbi:MAG: hypothetical protein EOM10_12065 [Opitutae bacterium]|nr:hypothetical protein [Opitutae bacterium]